MNAKSTDDNLMAVTDNIIIYGTVKPKELYKDKRFMIDFKKTEGII